MFGMREKNHIFDSSEIIRHIVEMYVNTYRVVSLLDKKLRTNEVEYNNFLFIIHFVGILNHAFQHPNALKPRNTKKKLYRHIWNSILDCGYVCFKKPRSTLIFL